MNLMYDGDNNVWYWKRHDGAESVSYETSSKAWAARGRGWITWFPKGMATDRPWP